jgi:hypothetical protein
MWFENLNGRDQAKTGVKYKIQNVPFNVEPATTACCSSSSERTMGCAGHGNCELIQKFWFENLKGIDHLEGPDADGSKTENAHLT